MDETAPQVVRDLLWVVNSPPFCEADGVEPAGNLRVEQIDQEQLMGFMEERGEYRVGRHFEHLLLFWLTRIRQVELVGAGIQLREGKRTVGEIDFLYRDEQNRLTHCEATVKFFLHHPRAGVSHYPGPNTTDNYERKTERLLGHQLEISKAHFPEIDRRIPFVKGMVFYRDDMTGEPVRPLHMPRDHGRGRWLRESEIDLLFATGASSGTVCEKPHWLASAAADDGLAPGELTSTLREHFDNGKAHPLMVTLFGDSPHDETQRVFVVSDQWAE